MEDPVSLLNLSLYFFIYSFLGWTVEVGWCAVTRRRFFNRGFASLPLLPSYGIGFVLLALALPTLNGRYVLQFLLTLIISSVVASLSDQIFRLVSPKLLWEDQRIRALSGGGKGFLLSLVAAGFYYLVYLVVHPMVMGFSLFIPELVAWIVVTVLYVLLGLDLLAVLYALRTGDAGRYRHRQAQSRQWGLADKLSAAIWRRLQRSYPGIQEMEPDEQAVYPFAEGLCLDKLIWVFLVSSLLGDIIETFYCRLVGGEWMSRSSLLYGPFSFVWGLGAVVLTVSLWRLSEKPDRYIFAAGFFIGGAYEYLCSVFTEVVFGTVFWDYSNMPLNIGGRTNVLFCFFWGVLAVVWLKILYPPMSKAIERFPALVGKIITWVVLLFMVCNAVLTAAAMVRYDTRTTRPEPANGIERFLDNQYDNEYMEKRWPNMVVVDPEQEELYGVIKTAVEDFSHRRSACRKTACLASLPDRRQSY